MKMYVFPRDETAESLEFETKPKASHQVLDGAIFRMSAFMLAWTAGAAAAAMIAF